MVNNRGTPIFSPKNNCVLNYSKLPEKDFGNFLAALKYFEVPLFQRFNKNIKV